MTDPITPDKLRELADDITESPDYWSVGQWKPSAPAALRAAADEIERIHGLIATRKAIYETKKVDALRHPHPIDSGRFERMAHAVEAFEYLEAEIGLNPDSEGG